MTIKEYTGTLISTYEDSGGKVNPDITLDIFKMIEGDNALLEEYEAVCNHANGGKDAVKQNIGKNIKAHYGLENDKDVIVGDKCSLITKYKRFK